MADWEGNSELSLHYTIHLCSSSKSALSSAANGLERRPLMKGVEVRMVSYHHDTTSRTAWRCCLSEHYSEHPSLSEQKVLKPDAPCPRWPHVGSVFTVYAHRGAAMTTMQCKPNSNRLSVFAVRIPQSGRIVTVECVINSPEHP